MAVAVGFLLFLFWLGFRIAPGYSVVFPEGGSPVLLGNDPWFHLHQARGSVEHFPELLRWDTGSNYPRGSYAAPAGLFNIVVAAVALLIGRGDPSIDLITAVLAWSPLVFGLASLLFFYGLAHEWGGHRLAVAALAIRVFFPGSELDRTVIGFGDYHAAEICLATLGLWLFLRYSRRVGDHEMTVVRWIRGWGAGLPFGIFLFVWTGAPLHIAVLLVSITAGSTLALVRGNFDERLAGHYVPYFAGLIVTVAVPGLLFPDLVMIGSGFRTTLAALTVQVILCLLAKSGLSSLTARTGKVKWLLPAGLLALLIAFAFYFAPERIRDLAGNIVASRNPFIAEHQAVTVSHLWETYGFLILWILPGLYGMGRLASFGKTVISGYLVLWVALWMVSRDFSYLVSALMPLPLAIGMRELPGLIRSAAGPLRFLPPVAALLTIGALVPMEKVRAPLLLRGDLAGMVVATTPWRDAMAWLREETPVPPLPPTHLAEPWIKGRGFDYPPGSYGILSHWQYGNLIPALGDRLAVSARNRSGTFIEWFLEQDEAASHARLETRGDVRYVIVDAESVGESFPGEAIQAGMEVDEFQVVEEAIALEQGDLELLSFGDDFRAAIGARLYLGDGPGMERYRLVYESPGQSFLRYRAFPDIRAVELRSTLVENEAMEEKIRPLTAAGESWTEPGPFFCYSGQMTSAVKIFERVRGAEVVGLADPSVAVKLELELFSPFTNRRFTYRRSAMTDGQGVFRLTVPYASGSSRLQDRRSVHALSSYRLTVEGGREVLLEVTEEDILSGASIKWSGNATTERR